MASGGRVHFILITDIARSSFLWEAFPRNYAAALERHNELLTGIIHRFEGEVLKNVGDGYIALFDSAQAAVSAAVAMQRALNGDGAEPFAPFPDGKQLTVRVIVHGGPLHKLDAGADWFGPPLNRAARIGSACHAGQTLISGYVLERLVELPENCSLLTLGVYKLRDIGEAEELYQVNHPSFPVQVFPPLKAGESKGMAPSDPAPATAAPATAPLTSDPAAPLLAPAETPAPQVQAAPLLEPTASAPLPAAPAPAAANTPPTGAATTAQPAVPPGYAQPPQYAQQQQPYGPPPQGYGPPQYQQPQPPQPAQYGQQQYQPPPYGQPPYGSPQYGQQQPPGPHYQQQQRKREFKPVSVLIPVGIVLALFIGGVMAVNAAIQHGLHSAEAQELARRKPADAGTSTASTPDTAAPSPDRATPGPPPLGPANTGSASDPGLSMPPAFDPYSGQVPDTSGLLPAPAPPNYNSSINIEGYNVAGHAWQLAHIPDNASMSGFYRVDSPLADYEMWAAPAVTLQFSGMDAQTGVAVLLYHGAVAALALRVPNYERSLGWLHDYYSDRYGASQFYPQDLADEWIDGEGDYLEQFAPDADSTALIYGATDLLPWPHTYDHPVWASAMLAATR